MTNKTICSAAPSVLSKSNSLRNYNNLLEAKRSRVLQHIKISNSLVTLEAHKLGTMIAKEQGGDHV